jgi:acyl-CoA dehydrogenase
LKNENLFSKEDKKVPEPIYDSEHIACRKEFRRFISKEVQPHLESWEEAGIVSREAWRKLGELGFLCTGTAKKYGGLQVDPRYGFIITEEMGRINSTGLMPYTHSDVAVPYIESYAKEEIKEQWLPRCVSGEIITGVAMTEPCAGSDLAAIRTIAVKDGNHYIVNGSKTFITNGIHGDLFITAVKTDPDASPPHHGISILLVPADAPGFSRGRKLKKMGMHAQDTAELFFDDCRVPCDYLLGEEGQGFQYLMHNLQQERLHAAVDVQARAEAMLALTIKHCRERVLFGRPLSKFQNTQFELVEMATEVELSRRFIDGLIMDHVNGRDVTKQVSMAKWWIPEMANRVAYRCVQLHGGYGYMEEYPICRFARDVRVTTIAAGSTEVMKVILAKMLDL